MMFKIYKRTTPDGKVYIGCTKNSLELRAGVGGSGYKQCGAFWSAIQKFGWDNIKSEIIEEVDSEELAHSRETFWIEQYQATNPDFGYNRCLTRKGNTSIAQRKRISDQMSKRICMHNETQFKRVTEDEVDDLLAAGWVFGLPPAVKASMDGSTTGKVWIHRKEEGKMVYPEQLDSYLQSGWELGTTLTAASKCREACLGRIRMHKGDINRMIPAEQVAAYEAEGWVVGVSDSYADNIGGARRGRNLKWMNDGSKNKLISPDDFDKYQQSGWTFGCIQKHSKRKK